MTLNNFLQAIDELLCNFFSNGIFIHDTSELANVLSCSSGPRFSDVEQSVDGIEKLLTSVRFSTAECKASKDKQRFMMHN